MLGSSEFIEAVTGLQKSWWPARSIVERSIAAATEASRNPYRLSVCVESSRQVHPSGEIMLLDSFCPWQSHLFDIEAEQGISGRTKYALYEVVLDHICP